MIYLKLRNQKTRMKRRSYVEWVGCGGKSGVKDIWLQGVSREEEKSFHAKKYHNKNASASFKKECFDA